MKAKALVLEGGVEVDWPRFEQAVHDRFGVNAVSLDVNGNRKTTGDILWANDLCALIKTNPKGAARICDALKRFLLHEAAVKRRCAADECGAGIYRILVPVVRDDEIEGFVSVCGRPFSSADRIYTTYVHETIDAGKEKIEGVLPSLRPIYPRTAKALRLFITGYGRSQPAGAA